MQKPLTYVCRYLISAFLVGACLLFSASAFAQSKKVTVNMNSRPLSELIKTIESKAGMSFVYESHAVDINQKVSVNLKDASVDEILAAALKGSQVNYSIKDNKIMLFPGNAPKSATAAVTGKVLDANGQSVIGASVFQKGTQNGTITDIDGNFSLQVPEGQTLVFSSIGYKSQEVKVDGRPVYQVTLDDDITLLEETVVIGYGTVKKKDLTGAVATVAPRAFKAQPVQGVSEMLRGNVPGVTVKETGTGEIKVRIRGANSLNGDNQPLYIVDGVPMGTYSPNDVESIEILKDASATAIYGSRGANGVVVVTTKRGKAGDPTIEVSANVSAATYPKYYDLLSGPEYAKFHNQYFGTNINFTNADTDWQRAITQTGLRQNYSATVSGGTDKVKYHVGGNYINNTGLVKNSNSETYRVRSNFDFKIGKKFTAKFDLSAQKNYSHSATTTGKNALLTALVWNPAAPLYDSEGNMTINDPAGITGFVSPYLGTMKSNNNSYSTNITANAYFAYDIIDGLRLSVQPSYNNTIVEERDFNPKGINDATASDAYAYRSTNNAETWNVTTLLNYDKTFGTDHNFNAMLGNEVWKNTNNSYSAQATGIEYEQLEWNNLEMSNIKAIKSSYSGSQLASFFARVNYNYASKYYVTASIRADGSSKFQEGNKFSYFPSAALGWVASNEDFLKDSSWLTFLKFRASYGVTGSQAISSYSTLTTLKTTSPWAFGTASQKSGISLSAPSNKDLQWESTTQIDFGADATICNVLSLSLDYWNKTTDGLLTKRVYPTYAGGGSSYINLGEMKNSGLDLSINYTPFETKDFSWTMTFNAGLLKNRVVDLGEMGTEYFPGNNVGLTGVQLETSPIIVQEGQPLGQFYGFNWLGLWKTSEAAEADRYGQKPGDNHYEDVNNDGKIDNADRMVIGNFMPKFTWSYNTTINWKNFDFNLLLEAAHGMDMMNFNKMIAGVVVGTANTLTLREAAENYWTESNQDTMWCPNSSSKRELANSSKWVEKAGYVKVRNISIGYTIPKSKLGGHEIRVNASVQNAFTFTNYTGLDPEASVNDTAANDLFGGFEYGVYPQPRAFTAGLTYKF